jgi:hypothetical protein
MAIIASIGTSQSNDGREAGSQAAHLALGKMNRAPASLALVLATHDYSLPQVASGIASYLSEVPLLGFSTLGTYNTNEDSANTAAGSRRSVTVALLGGDLKARADWWPSAGEDSPASLQRKLAALQPTQVLQTASLNLMPAQPRTGSLAGHTLILALDGLTGEAEKVVGALPEGRYNVLGCLAGGAVSRGVTYQAGGRQSGAGGCAAALVSGNLSISTGYAHGWQRIGAFARITRARGPLLEELDGRPAVEVYARLFDYPPASWTVPPLDEFVRLYPLGIDTPDGGLRVLSPLRVEATGALRMQTAPPQGAAVHVLAASAESCIAAAQSAASQALAALKSSSPPILALVLADAAWQLLLQARPEAEFQAVRAILGDEIPVVGGYTFGQIARPQPNAPAELLTQHILVALFAVG